MNAFHKFIFIVFIELFTLVLISGFSRAYGQSMPDAEVLLTFNYPSVGQVYVNSVIFGDTPFLPVSEVLSLLEIPFENVSETRGLRGFYPTQDDQWEINPNAFQILAWGQTETLSKQYFYFGELDLYLHPSVFLTVFGLDLSMNIEGLTLSLKAKYSIPIEEKKKREQLRAALLYDRYGDNSSPAPLLFPRERKILNMGMIDYNISQFFTSTGNQTQGLFNMGLEALGGDVSGSILIDRSQRRSNADFRGLRWRYVLPGAMEPKKNVGLTSISVGDIFTTGQSRIGSIVGVSLTNDPIVPRQELDLFVIDGYTEADSEVELLIGGQLVDFARADEVGYYRFNAPINFGTIRLTIRIYTPQGKVIQEDRQLQIPFTFLPKKFVTYNLQAGLPRVNSDSLSNQFVAHADVAYGLSNSITVRAGTDFPAGKQNIDNYSYLGLSARVFQQYLLNAELVPNRFFQANASVVYPKNTSFNAQFKQYFQDSLFNPRGILRDYSINYFMPFQIFGNFSGIRIGGISQVFTNQIRNSFQADFNTQLGRLVARINYRGNFDQFEPTESEVGFTNQNGLFTGSLTYTLSRSPGVPVFVRGMFIRGRVLYDPSLGNLRNWNLLISQTLFKRGRFTLGYERNLLGRNGQIQIGFLYDFNFFRSSSQFNRTPEDYSIQQSFSGSFAYDPIGNIVPSNRDQVNRSGVAVKLFIDENNNGVHDEEEKIIAANAVRLDRSATTLIGSDGIIRLSQLQSYWTYRMEIDKNALPDPTLAPKTSIFSFVAEPNRYKMIEVPLYRTGTISGNVFFQNSNGDRKGQGGIRLFLKNEKNQSETLRTFTDGGFYSFGLMPGKYSLIIDSQQLDYIERESLPQKLEFEIAAVANGDFIENLDFTLIPKNYFNEESELNEENIIKIQSMIKFFVEARDLAYGNQFDEAMKAIDKSLEILISDQGLALKGSIYYLKGEKDLAVEYWNLAKKRNPEIIIPELENK